MRPVVVIGMGELGSVFARGFLRRGRPVYPVTRSVHPAEVVERASDAELVLAAVGEKDLGATLYGLPSAWRDRVGLLQNELLPRDWQAHDIVDPSVAVVWFEKKPNAPIRELLPTVLAGPHADLLAEALSAVGVASRVVQGAHALLSALVQKNLYILVTNIAGLETGGTVGDLAAHHRELMDRVTSEVIEIQQSLCGSKLDRLELVRGLEQAIAADPAHACTGRSAPSRLERALAHARAAGLEVPELGRIFALTKQ